MNTVKFSIAFGILLSIGLGSVSAQQPLHERMPGESLLYVEWSGVDAIQDARKDTPLGRLLDDPGVARLLEQVTDTFTMLVRQNASEGTGPEMVEAVFHIIPTVWHRPVALDIFDVSFSPETGPRVEGAVAVDVGDMEGAAALIKSLDTLLDEDEETRDRASETVLGYNLQRLDTPIGALRYGRIDGVFVATLGETAFEKVLNAMQGKIPTVAQDERFVHAMQKIGTTGRTTTAMVHLDVRAIFQKARGIWSTMTQADAFPPMVEGGLEAASITRLRSVTGLWQISDQGFRQTFYVALPTDNGRPKWMHQAPVTEADLAIIPEDVSFATVTNMRLIDQYDGIMHVIDGIGPLAQTPANGAIAMVEGLMGMNIRNDILARFGDTWTFYNRPDDGGILFTGAVLLIESSDAEGLIELLKRIVLMAAQKISGEATVIDTMSHGGHTIHYVSFSGLPVPVAPAWAAHENRIIIALYPQIVAQTIDRLSTPHETSILTNADFQRARKLLPETCSSIGYADMKAFSKWAYKFMLPAATAGAGWARGEGVPVDAAMIPTASTFTDPMFGVIKGVAPDSDGLLITSHGPLPVDGVMIAANLTSVLLPSLTHARFIAKRTVSLANTRAIMAACHIYAANHDGVYPPDLETLIRLGSLSQKQLISPNSGSDENAYIYIAGCDPENCDAGTVIVYENPRINMGEDIPVGFSDGHAALIAVEDLDALLDRSREAAKAAKKKREAK